MSYRFELTLFQISVWIVPLVFAITLHEAAHGYVARLFGDMTASRLGRVSLNPLNHIDLFGTALLPALLLMTHAAFLFGYAKPVPVNFRALRNPKIELGARRRGRAGDELAARGAQRRPVPRGPVPAERGRGLGRRQSEQCAGDQRAARGVQPAADFRRSTAAASWLGSSPARPPARSPRWSRKE